MADHALGTDTVQAVAVIIAEPSGTLSPVPQLPPGQPLPISLAANVGVSTHQSLGLKLPVHTPIDVGPHAEIGQSSGGFDWFETWHVVPRSFNFGQLLSSQSPAIQVFNAFRRLPQREWATFVNNAGLGVELGGIPTLAVNVDPLTSVEMTLDVDIAGQPFVDDTLDFGFTGVGTIYVNVIIRRIVLWGLEPELPYNEDLEFFTNVLTSQNGKEKRSSPREYPRQVWAHKYLIEQGLESALFDNLFFDFQARQIGVPVWWEDTFVSSNVSVGDLTFNVDETAYRDFRVGGFVVLFTSQAIFDVLVITVITATTITVNSPSTNVYLPGTRVMPISITNAEQRAGGQRWRVGLRSQAIKFRSIDNNVDHADLTPFSSYKSKLFLDNGNSALSGTVSQTHGQNFTVIDGVSGEPEVTSPWDRNKLKRTFTLRASGRQAVWEMRGLIYALRGKQVSFWVPTDTEDLAVTQDLLSASNLMSVTNVGYAQFVRERKPKSDIRVNFVDGSTPLLREITASSSPSVTEDQLTVDTNWPSTITPAEISRVEYVEKVRLDTDKVRIRYDGSGHRAYMTAPIVSVFE